MTTLYPRTNYEMSEADLQSLLDACKPVPYMIIGNSMHSSPQENANLAWKKLGDKMGFDWNTVEPDQRKGTRFFSAIPTEPEKVRDEREQREAEESKQQNIKDIMQHIDDLQAQLKALRN